MFTVNSDKSVTTFYNGKIEETVGAEIGGGGDPILTILFRPLETYPVGERKNYFQLNALMPFVADTLEKT